MATVKTEEATELNLYQKLSKVRKLVEAVKKNKRGYNYSYVTEDELLSKITAGMDKYHLSLYPSIIQGSTRSGLNQFKKTKVTKAGEVYEENVNEYMVQSDMEWTWINDDNPEERYTVPWALIGCQGDASQAFGSGLTYSSRYFKLKFFNVATTEDDPDNFRSKQAEALATEDKIVTQKIIDQINTFCRTLAAENPKTKDEISVVIKDVCGSANYLKIKDPQVAAKLLEQLKAKFTNTEKEVSSVYTALRSTP